MTKKLTLILAALTAALVAATAATATTSGLGLVDTFA